MTDNEILEQLMQDNNGYLLSSMATEKNISKTFLAKYVKENHLEPIARGIYIADDVLPDELYIMQVRNAAVIFSGETALYLHNLTEREYSKICISVPTGYNATHLKANNVQVKYAPKDKYGLGICSVPSTSGNMVRVYDKERCICDLITNRRRTEVQDFQAAIKAYMSENSKKLSKLIEYAKKLGIRDELMKYVEVLG